MIDSRAMTDHSILRGVTPRPGTKLLWTRRWANCEKPGGKFVGLEQKWLVS